MKEMTITGTSAKMLVDDEWYEILSRHKWQIHPKSGYVYRTTSVGFLPDGRRRIKSFYVARVVMGVEWESRFEIEVDHKDRNKLNNQRDNLRLATRVQNIMNRPSKPGSASRFKGVTVHLNASGIQVFRSKFRFQGKETNLGRFATEEEAARAYDAAVLKIHGEFAYLNFPQAGKNQKGICIY